MTHLKKSILRFPALLLAVCMVLSASVTALVSFGAQTPGAADFSDLKKSAWYYEAVDFCVAEELFVGTQPGKFSPATALSRAMYAALLYRIAQKICPEKVTTLADTGLFPDVRAKDWYADSCRFCKAAGIISGLGDGSFGGNVSLTREQAAAMTIRFLNWATDLEIPAGGLSFRDNSKISSYAKGSVASAVALGIFTGKTGNVFDPLAEISRAEAAQMLYNLFGKEDSLLSLEPKHQHVEETVPGTPATCTEPGLTDGVKCAECGEILTEQTEIPALGHDEVPHEGQEPTCDACGWKAYVTCSRCDYTTYEAIPAAEHTAEVIPAVPATCIETGLSEGAKCAVCGTILKQQEVTPLAAHTEEEIPAVPATCTEKGKTAGVKCSVCGTVLVEQEKIKALGHTEEILPAVEPTAEGPGLTEGVKCSVCGEILVQQNPVCYEHSFSESVDFVPATGGICTQTVKTCDVCGYAEGLGDIRYSDKLPILELTGDTTGMTKENTVTLQADYRAQDANFNCVCTMKWQGASSLDYEKKNYNIKLFKDETLEKKNKVDLGWGKENKYCLKANYIDRTNTRNIVSAKLWHDVVMSRPNLPAPFADLPNGGAIDGFPVMLYINEIYQGLYTLNIPKDKWMLETDDVSVMGIMTTEDWSSEVYFRQLATVDGGHWGIEENAMESDQALFDSLNNLIGFVMTHSGNSFKNGIGQYLDVDSYIDYMIFTMAAALQDNRAKNCMFVTYDGVKWYTTMYDMDASWGLVWHGAGTLTVTAMFPTFNSNGTVISPFDKNQLAEKMLQAFGPEIRARYFELREGALSTEAIQAKFDAFAAMIPDKLHYAEEQIYPLEPGLNLNTVAKAKTWIKTHMKGLDGAMRKLPEA